MHQDYLDKRVCDAHYDIVASISELRNEQKEISIKLDRNTVEIKNINQIMVSLLDSMKENTQISRDLIGSMEKNREDYTKTLLTIILALLSILAVGVFGVNLPLL
jgi:nucleoside-triphosphatase THEP1